MVNDEKLIEQIKRFQHLYDLGHPKYMDPQRKNMAWREISKELKQPVVACKQRWQCLRDSYRRILRKRSKTHCADKPNMKKWKYEKEMAFLIPFFVERKPSQYDASTDEEASEDTTDENIVSTPSLHKSIRNTSAIPSTSSTVDADRTAQNNRNSTYISQEPNLSVLMAHILERAKEKTDDMDSFFLNISSTVKKFSPYQQALAKNQIFTLVSEMEIKQLEPPVEAAPTTTTWARPGSPVYMPTSPTYMSTSPSHIPKTETNTYNVNFN
ncbi:uncharacterized protein LOC115447192 [Manduca sexta]|uniref:MADF domain-containing protein n=1 Tax=Manduca sexta TaxID=7130 RepID=A0A921ZFH0_MANSE|nr:uncharacterized protein LOC115447192 [Manduca sexta]KAG6455897.1 hypothetical protein O3G_MSEX009461 [Manduca sexta]